MDKNRSRFGLMLAASWAAVLWERALAAFFPALLVGGVFLIAVKSGVLLGLPAAVRYGVSGLFGLAFLAALVRGFRVKLPSDADASAWLDGRNPDGHRAAAAWLDKLPGAEAAGPERTIWDAYRARVEARLSGYRLGLPHSPLRDLDPYAIRNAVALGLIATWLVAGVPIATRVAELAKPPVNAAAVASLDVWLSPPAYTGKPPILVTGAAKANTDPQGVDKPFQAPQGSKLTARVSNVSAATVEITPSAGGPVRSVDFKIDSAGNGEAHAVIDASGRIAVKEGAATLGAWSVAVIPDAPPEITIAEPIEVTGKGQMAIGWTASDDYGVSSIKSKIALAPQPADGAAVDAASPFLKKAPQFDVALQSLNPKQAKGKAFQDLTENYWAGLTVDMAFVATDQAGQTGTSNVVRIALPERAFTVPLAQALAEQRTVLIRTPGKKQQVVRTLAALMAWPEDIFPSSGAYLAVQEVTSNLYEAKTDEEIGHGIDALWKIAVGIEDGNVDQSLQDLEAARRALQKAIAEGAPPDKIAELTQKLREAMNKYLEAMRQQMMDKLRNGQAQNQQQQQQGQELRQQDLQKMLDNIENLAKSGSKDAAQQLLSQLEEMLKNLQPQMSQQNGDQQGPMGQMMDQLGQMMREQQKLMDETFRMQGQQGQQGQDGQQQQGQQGQQGQGRQGEGRSGDQLSQDQQGLGQTLEEMLRQFGEMGMDSPQGMNRAGKAMRDAAEALKNGDKDSALQAQNDALQGLREGARSMADQMMQQGQGEQGRYSRNGRSKGDDRDPLGRPMPRTGEDYGPDQNMVPGEAAVERARRILEYLRNRAGEANRPKVEMDYFDRLLQGLY
ncbi:MAG: TIGR02302 family protein [Hyphomicrobiales bacterium]